MGETALTLSEIARFQGAMSRPDPFKLRSPFFRSPKRRGLVVGACIGWSLIELVLGNSVWFALFFALGCYLGYEFFVMFDPADYEEKDDER